MNEGFHPLSTGGKWKSLIVLFLVGMVIVNALILWYGRSFGIEGYADFSAFYTAGKLLERGQGSHLYDPNAQWAVQQEFASKVTIRHKALPYIRPPFEAVLFLPFAVFPYKTAFILWTVVNIGLLFIFPFLLQSSGFPVGSRWLQGLLCFSYVPVAIALLHGQDAILMLLILTMVMVRIKQGVGFRAGLWLSLGLVKFHLILPIALILALRRRASVVVGFISGSFVLFCVSIVIVGWRGLISYPGYLRHLNGVSNAGMASPESMPNLRGLSTIFWGTKHPPAFADWLLAFIVLAGVMFVAYVWRADKNDSASFDAGFAIAIITILLTSYYAYSYDMIVLILPLFLLAGILIKKTELQGWPQYLFFGVAIILCSPVLWLIFFGFAGRFYLAMPLMLFLLIISIKVLKLMQPTQRRELKIAP